MRGKNMRRLYANQVVIVTAVLLVVLSVVFAWVQMQ
jgi:hypothetical protein